MEFPIGFSYPVHQVLFAGWLNFLICTSNKITLLDHILLPTFSEVILKRAVDTYIKGLIVAQRYNHLESR